MSAAPITKQRSEWEPIEHPVREQLEGMGAKSVGVWSRRIGDGVLMCFAALEPAGWHLSISFHDHKGRPSRYPRWDEITDARYRLGAIPDEVTMAMLLPPPGEYVAVHDTTFHLHEIAGES